MKELPDSIRVPLDSLWADAGYLFGRVSEDPAFMHTAVRSVKDRIDAAKKAMFAELTDGDLVKAVDMTACMLRGMTLDPAIPKHVKDAMWSRIRDLETLVERYSA